MKKRLLITVFAVAGCMGNGKMTVVHDTIMVKVVHDTVVVGKGIAPSKHINQKAIYHPATSPAYPDPNSNDQRVLASNDPERMERMFASKYIDLQTNCHHNVIFKEYEFTGSLTNNATTVDYKDVEIQVTQYSETNTIVSQKTYVMYKYYKRGIRTPFKLTVDKEDGTDYATCEVLVATPYTD